MSYAKAAVKVMQRSISFVNLKEIPRNKDLTVIQTFNRVAFSVLTRGNFQSNQENLWSRNLQIHSPRFSQEPKH